MSVGSIQVKAYLNWTNNEPEIRRFLVDSDASTNYEYLLEKIRTVYPCLKREDIQLFWRGKQYKLLGLLQHIRLVWLDCLYISIF